MENRQYRYMLLFRGSVSDTKRRMHEDNIKAEAYRRLRNKNIDIELERSMECNGNIIRPDMLVLKENKEIAFLVEFKHANYGINGFVDWETEVDDQIRKYLNSGYWVYVCSGMDGIDKLERIFA
jgi:hypothetical protein